MKLKIGLLFLITTFFCLCNSSDKFKISFEGVKSFDTANIVRIKYLQTIKDSDQSKERVNKLIYELDSLYWEKTIQILDSSTSAIIHSKISPTQRIFKLNELEQNFNEYKHTGILTKQNEEKIKNIFVKIENNLVNLRHLQAWDNKRKDLLFAIKDFSRKNFQGSNGKINLENEIIDIIDSVEINDDGEVKKIDYTINYLKIYKGNWFRWRVYGNGKWRVTCQNNSIYINVINLCPDCYSEIRIEDK